MKKSTNKTGIQRTRIILLTRQTSKPDNDVQINIIDIDHDPLAYVAVSEVLITLKALESLEVTISFFAKNIDSVIRMNYYVYL